MHRTYNIRFVKVRVFGVVRLGHRPFAVAMRYQMIDVHADFQSIASRHRTHVHISQGGSHNDVPVDGNA